MLGIVKDLIQEFFALLQLERTSLELGCGQGLAANPVSPTSSLADLATTGVPQPSPNALTSEPVQFEAATATESLPTQAATGKKIRVRLELRA